MGQGEGMSPDIIEGMPRIVASAKEATKSDTVDLTFGASFDLAPCELDFVSADLALNREAGKCFRLYS